MPAYKDKDSGKWLCKFYYQDGNGNKRQKKKMGFDTKKQALEYEREYLLKRQGQPTMLLSSFINLYETDQFPQLRQNSIRTKGSRYKKIMETFPDMPLNEISPRDIKAWQNKLISLDHSNGYIKALQTEFSILLNHAVRFYGLPKNPIHMVKLAKNPNYIPPKMRYRTFEEFRQVYNQIDNIKSKTAINLLYFTGMRKGELDALTWEKIDFENKTILIDRSLQRLKGKDVVTQTKTYESRKISLPNTTLEILGDYKNHCYNINKEYRVFQWEKRYVENGIKQGVEKANQEIKEYNKSHEDKKPLIKRIHVHGLRHSHASYLINHNINIVLISKRLGHKNTSITLDTYSHFFPIAESKMIDVMNNEKL